MTLRKWLKQIDPYGIKCNIWIDEDCVYAGDMGDIPFWAVEYELDDRKITEDPPICWCHQIRSTPDNEGGTKGLNGFVICLKETDD